MLIKIPQASSPKAFEVTDEAVFLNRRQFIGSTLSAAMLTGSSLAMAKQTPLRTALDASLAQVQKTAYGQGETLTPYEIIASHNNFYEFGTEKTDPAQHAHAMKVDPWSIEVSGHAERTGTFALEDILGRVTLEERIYRFRCVEGWSMVVPWIGFPLASLIKHCAPTSKAKYVFFETLQAPEQMPGQRSYFSSIDWPYVEGLRMDEAMHPLTLLAVGLYGKIMPNQNGAPIRLVVPWKYGFKSIKSIVRIKFLEERVRTTWELAGPTEYGFYSNVNPEVDHPRWSQKEERRLPSTFFAPNKVPTQKFNGYSEVASLYSGMDLRQNF
jgi:methionine sulfoxide reductase catalytic subunit